ncbi:hypothetical protein RYX36_005676, partial [Vicia faba]
MLLRNIRFMRKTGSSSWIEETKLHKEDYDDTIWKQFRKLRKDESRWDYKYVHRTENFSCRSLNDVKRYEETGKRPSEIRKIKLLENGAKTTDDVGKIEKMLLEKRKREEEKSFVEKFLADAHYNLLHWFDDKQPESE